MERAAASGWRGEGLHDRARGVASPATVSELIGRNPMPGTSAPTSSQRRRARRATSSSAPERRPLTQTRPKLRTDAPVGPASASRWSTENPASASSSACQVPMMPPPATTARPRSPLIAGGRHAARIVTGRSAAGARRGADGVGRLPRSRLPEDGAAGHQDVGAGRHGDRRRVGVDAAVHLDVERRAPRASTAARTCATFGHDVGDEALAAEAGEDRHAQDQVDVARGRAARPRTGVSGLRANPARRPRLRICVMSSSVSADLDVHRAAVGPGVGEVLQVAPRLGHHEVAVEEQRRVVAQRGHHGRPDRHVGDEVPVHDVDVEPVGRGRHLPHLLGQHAEVGRQHRRRDAQVSGAARVAARLSSSAASTVRAAAQLKRAQQRMRRNP